MQRCKEYLNAKMEICNYILRLSMLSFFFYVVAMPLELPNFLREIQSVEKDEWLGVAAADDAISDDECCIL